MQSLDSLNHRIQERVRKFWEFLLVKQRTPLERFVAQILMAGIGFGGTTLLYYWTHIYTGAVTLVTTILVVLSGEILFGLTLTLILIILCDYFYLPPLKSVFNTPDSFDHFLAIAITAVVVSLLVSSLRAAYRSSVRAKQEAEAAKHEAELAAEAMEKILALVSHDVRNPLTAVKIMAQLIQSKPERFEKNQELAGRIIGDLARVDGMIQTLLDVSRVRAGQEIPLQFVSCDLRSVVSSVIEDLATVLGGRLVFSAEQSILGTWSQDGLSRAIENLVMNAVKYGDSTAPIEVKLCQLGDHARISVHNRGNEIAPEDQARLFDTYQRGLTGSHKKGWGLGLALVKGVAEAHLGTASVESVKGQGTTFTLDLPIRAENSVKALSISRTEQRSLDQGKPS